MANSNESVKMRGPISIPYCVQHSTPHHYPWYVTTRRKEHRINKLMVTVHDVSAITQHHRHAGTGQGCGSSEVTKRTPGGKKDNSSPCCPADASLPYPSCSSDVGGGERACSVLRVAEHVAGDVTRLVWLSNRRYYLEHIHSSGAGTWQAGVVSVRNREARKVSRTYRSHLLPVTIPVLHNPTFLLNKRVN